MDYLRGNATANALGIFVICKYLSAHSSGRTEAELRGALEVLRPPQDDSNTATAVLTASLAIGKGLGLIARESPSSPWCLSADWADSLQRAEGRWEGFRGPLTQRIMEQGSEQLRETSEAPDLLRGIQTPVSTPNGNMRSQGYGMDGYSFEPDLRRRP